MESPTTGTSPVLWRRLDRHLWGATRDGYTFGTVERGSRYSAIDAEGEVLGRYRTLEDAMHALVDGRRQQAAAGGALRVVERTLFTVTSGFGAGAIGVVILAFLRGTAR